MSKIDKLIEEADAGRGLWIGLLPEKGGKPFSEWDTPDSHCTLLHLGKQNTTYHVASALAVAQCLAREFSPVNAWCGGLARFKGSEAEGDPIVVLFQQPILRRMHERARTLFALLGTKLRPDFDYTPHLTLRRVSRQTAWAFEAPLNFCRVLDRVVVVCGEGRIELPLREAV